MATSSNLPWTKKQQIVEFALGGEEEEEIVTESQNPEDEKFDTVVGELEDLIMGGVELDVNLGLCPEQYPSFTTLQTDFFSATYHHFTPDEENKLVYTDVFHQYVTLVEAFIEKRLRSRLPWFDMQEWVGMLKSRPDTTDGDVFEILTTLGDFNAFKEMILAYREEKEGTALDLSSLLSVTPSRSTDPKKNNMGGGEPGLAVAAEF
ncbi:ADP-ribosylation factor-like protein 2-binding protein [Rhizophlyctis rosea]|nr:ADP-ribosylation factor-like protein 2-binding protein [Rhizophlyctis rosea]